MNIKSALSLPDFVDLLQALEYDWLLNSSSHDCFDRHVLWTAALTPALCVICSGLGLCTLSCVHTQ